MAGALRSARGTVAIKPVAVTVGGMDGLSDRLPEFEDPLEPLGILAGGFLVLVGLATLVGMPWSYNNNLLAAVGQILGTLGTIAVGAGLVWLAQTRRDELPTQ